MTGPIMPLRPLVWSRGQSLDATRRRAVTWRASMTLAFLTLALPACGGKTPSPPDAGNDASSDLASTDLAPCPTGNLVCNPLAPFPATLAEAGLLAPAPRFVAAAGAHSYVPTPELYSDGLHKDRLLLLPRNQDTKQASQIDNTNRVAWKFPVGTLAIKTFFDEGGPATSPRRPIETRLVRIGTDRFEPVEFAVYQWNADATRAERIDIAGNRRGSAPVVIAGRSFVHTIPSQNDCAECHNRNAKVRAAVIGFDEIRLNHTATPSTRSRLDELAALGLFKSALPTAPMSIADPDPVLAQVKRFVFGNCVHCHNGSDNLVDLQPDVFVANTIDQLPESPGLAVPPGMKRVVPGRPDDSVVFLQTRGTNLPLGLRPMPQIGVEVRDLPAFAVELENLATWIRSLPPK
jgi:hypothetical protein